MSIAVEKKRILTATLLRGSILLSTERKGKLGVGFVLSGGHS